MNLYNFFFFSPLAALWEKGSELERNYTWQLYLKISVAHSFVPVFCFSHSGLKCLDEQLKINNAADTAIQYQTISRATMSRGVGQMWIKCRPLMHAWLCCPDGAKTMAGNDVNGDLEKQKNIVWRGSHESLADNGSKCAQEQWSTSYWQHSQPPPDARVRKKRGEKKKTLIVWLFGPLSIWSQGYSPPGCSEASSPRDGRLNSNSWVLIFFRHLFALGLPDVSCLAPAPPQPGQGPAHLPVLPAQRWCETFGSHQMCLPKAPRW